MTVNPDLVTEWDVEDGGVRGALIACPYCLGRREPCTEVTDPHGCGGTRTLFRPYELPEPTTPTDD